MQRLPGGGEVGPADALIMARSGLQRVGLADRIAYEFTPREMLPAAGQGIVAVECAAGDWHTRRYLSLIDDSTARASCDAEREVLWVLNGHCNSPIAPIPRSRVRRCPYCIGAGWRAVHRSHARGPGESSARTRSRRGARASRQGAAEIIARTRPEA